MDTHTKNKTANKICTIYAASSAIKRVVFFLNYCTLHHHLRHNRRCDFEHLLSGHHIRYILVSLQATGEVCGRPPRYQFYQFHPQVPVPVSLHPCLPTVVKRFQKFKLILNICAIKSEHPTNLTTVTPFPIN